MSALRRLWSRILAWLAPVPVRAVTVVQDGNAAALFVDGEEVEVDWYTPDDERVLAPGLTVGDLRRTFVFVDPQCVRRKP